MCENAAACMCALSGANNGVQDQPLVLVVDEPAALVNLCKECLPDYTVLATGTSAEALRLIKEMDFAIMLTGLDTVDMVRTALSSRPALACIAMTEAMETDSLLGALRAGMCDIISKPLNRDELVKAADRARHRRAQRRPTNLRANVLTAESLEQEKKQFRANMSHELRTPLTAVIGMSQLLDSTDLSDTQKKYVEIIESSGANLMAIIDDILTFSSVEEGSLKIDSVNFNAQHLASDTVTRFESRGRQKGLTLTAEVGDDVPMRLLGDTSRLRKVLQNLLDNAIKFTKQGAITLRVLLEEDETSTATLRFEVQDTGIGVASADRPRLFASFSQVDGSRTREYGGTGMGLAFCKHLVELMNGSVGVDGGDDDSGSDSGSIFWFSIKFRKAAEQRPAPVVSLKEMKELHVLLVDPDRASRDLLQEQLGRKGIEITTAADGVEALDLLGSSATDARYRVAIADMDLEGMDGPTFGRLVAREPVLAAMPMIMLASNPQPGQAQLVKDAGFSGYLTRPVSISDLYDCIRTVLGAAEVNANGEMPLITRHTLAEDKAKLEQFIVGAGTNDQA